jgi:hypothetical protein
LNADIEMGIKVVGWDDVNWIPLAKDEERVADPYKNGN